MQDSVFQRIETFISALKISTRKFERTCGFSNGYINSLKTAPSERKQNAIKEAFPQLNMVWLLTGEGDMLVEDNSTADTGTIRLWHDIEATGGGVTLFDDGVSNDYSLMSIPGFADCTDAVTLRGDSMYPTLRSGQIIILKRWTESYIDYGQIYLIVTTSGNRMVKYVRRGTDDAHITCVSENKEYDDFDVLKEDILAMYLVKGGIQLF